MVIFFVPIIGGLFYFFSQVINKSNLKSVGQKVTAVVDPKKKIRDLEKKLSSSDTFQNNLNLADAFLDNNNITNAIIYYEKALDGKLKNHPTTLHKMLQCYFKNGQHKKVIACASKIDLEKSFRDSICIYAISLEKCNYFEEAEVQFRKTDKRYSNYAERLELSEFLIKREKIQGAQIVLTEIVSEIENMIETNKKKHKFVYQQSSKLLNEI
ncbi:CDC27 family protein [Polaribacter sp. IC063]|uniref:CDC27 family protein n=1 Tax=Polaribacter sp. IC063 TaxID=57031 RepID=UPI001675AD0F|nr:CDC27 family protein [Polaribacter sp. IC063]